MVLLCAKLFLRGDEVVSICIEDFNPDLAVESLAVAVQGKCDPTPVTLMLWSDDVLPELCPIRHVEKEDMVAGAAGSRAVTREEPGKIKSEH